MKNGKSKCNCAKNGGMCGRKLSLIKQGKLTPDRIKKEVVCPLKSMLTYASQSVVRISEQIQITLYETCNHTISVYSEISCLYISDVQIYDGNITLIKKIFPVLYSIKEDIKVNIDITRYLDVLLILISLLLNNIIKP